MTRWGIYQPEQRKRLVAIITGLVVLGALLAGVGTASAGLRRHQPQDSAASECPSGTQADTAPKANPRTKRRHRPSSRRSIKPAAFLSTVKAADDPFADDPSSGDFGGDPFANDPTSGDFGGDPFANDPTSGDSGGDPFANDPTSGDSGGDPFANDPTSGDSGGDPFANDPSSGDSGGDPFANDPSSGDSGGDPFANDPNANDPNNDPFANDPNNDPNANDPNNDPFANDPNNDPNANDPNNDPFANDPNNDPTANDPNNDPFANDPNADPTDAPVANPTEAPPAANPNCQNAPNQNAPDKNAPDKNAPSQADPSQSAPSQDVGTGPFKNDFIDINQVQPTAQPNLQAGQGGSSGTFDSQCGNNENGHHNSDNFIVAPGVSNGAQHTHDYVGNDSTDGNSTNDSLKQAGTTCAQQGDKSAYFWPVLRMQGVDSQDANSPGGGVDGNVGAILTPQVTMVWKGNPTSKVTAMPKFLRVITGDAKAVTNGPANAKAKWTCTGLEDRTTTLYPLCPAGSKVERLLDFPSCWDGQNIDSANHRTHILFPDAAGACPNGTKAVPQLEYKLLFTVPAGVTFAVDSFPEQKHNPLTDHGDFTDVMSRSLENTIVNCINQGQTCK